ncbi:MAG: DUF3604 domain-containing protein [Anaerolineae bacterium]
MPPYQDLHVYYGDLHNHCGISYGHGSLDDAFLNAREQLDFCSVTGHALWPDMPAPDETIQHIVDFHEEGFARLRRVWADVQRTTEAYHRDGEFVTFLSFEMHSCADGDRTILYGGSQGEILDVMGLEDLHERLRALRRQGVRVMAFPHHIAYKRGQRGINWTTFDPDIAPVVEIISMHGCSTADEGPRPFLHSMGPADHESTMQYGLDQGHVFGVIGSTDHHSAHPGSYGHGRTGLWASAKTRAAIWEALSARRTYALTGDRIVLHVSLNDAPMGAVLPCRGQREIAFRVVGGAPLDYVDVLRDGRLLRRWSQRDVPEVEEEPSLRTKLTFEVGWGTRGKRVDWDVHLGISEGRILSVEPRFRGPELVAPTEVTAETRGYGHWSHWEPEDERSVQFHTVTLGNPNNVTPATQAICLDVEMPVRAHVWAEINGRRETVPLRRLLEGAFAGRLGKIDSPAYRFHRAPRWSELAWSGSCVDPAPANSPSTAYTFRVRQQNDQWAWSSPIWVRCA